MTTPAPQRTPRPKRSETRERLIDGAMLAFAEKGFAGASIDLICAKAGFSRGAFYSNFADKDELFFALYERRTDLLYARIGRIAEAAKSDPDPLARISELLAEPDWDELRWDILNKEFILYALRNTDARARLIRSRQGSRDRLSEIITRMAPDLARRPDALATLCRLIIALHEGELTQLGLEPALQSGPSLLSHFVPMAIGALREHP